MRAIDRGYEYAWLKRLEKTVAVSLAVFIAIYLSQGVWPMSAAPVAKSSLRVGKSQFSTIKSHSLSSLAANGRAAFCMRNYLLYFTQTHSTVFLSAPPKEFYSGHAPID